MAVQFKIPKTLGYLLEDSTNKANVEKLKDLINDYITKNIPKGAKLKGRQDVPGLPELIKFQDGKGVKLTNVSSNYNKGKRVGFGYTDLEGSNIREDMLTLMTDKSGAASQTRYGRVARKLPKGFEDHHRRFRTLFQPFYEGLSESDANKLTQWFVEQEAPLGNVLENLEGVDTDLHRTMENSIHSWARTNNIQVDMGKPGQKNFFFDKNKQTVAVKGGASNIEGIKGPDGKLKFIPDKRPPVVTGAAFGSATKSTFPNISHLSLNERLLPASDFLEYVDQPLQDYTAEILRKQDIWQYGKDSDKVRSVDQIKAVWADKEANAAARARILADNPNVTAADLDSPSPKLLSMGDDVMSLRKIAKGGAIAGIMGVSVIGTGASAVETDARVKIAKKTNNWMDKTQAGISGFSLANDLGSYTGIWALPGGVLSTGADLFNMAIDSARTPQTKEESEKEIKDQTESDKYDFTTL
jgi:hypothetical protein